MSDDTNPVGRPPKFRSVLELEKLIDEYFAWCEPHPEIVTEWIRPTKTVIEKNKKGKDVEKEVTDYDEPMYTHEIERLTTKVPYTVNGLALFLDTTRETLNKYEYMPEFTDTIKRAKTRIENELELGLYGNNVTGLIFNLKNNYGWKDKTETDITTKGESIKGEYNKDIADKFEQFMLNETKT